MALKTNKTAREPRFNREAREEFTTASVKCARQHSYKNRRTREDFIAAAMKCDVIDGVVTPQFMAARLRVSYNEAKMLIEAAQRGGLITADGHIFNG
jgi:hypothetical protein